MADPQRSAGRGLLLVSGLLASGLAVATVGCGGRKPLAEPPPKPETPADLVLIGGDIITLDTTAPRASGIAVRADRIVWVGADDEVRAHIGPNTKVIALEGRSVSPGLVDAHAHLYGLGVAMESISLRGANSEAAAAAIVAAADQERPEGQWLTGRGWDQNLWSPAEFPTAATLDAISPTRPMALRRVDGHALWANSAAMKFAGITAATKDPDGGRIVRDATGNPTGVFIDNAMDLVEARVPVADAATRRRRILAAAKAAVAVGLTGVHEMGIDDATVAVYRELAASGELPLRIYGVLAGDIHAIEGLLDRKPDLGEADSRFTLRAVKLFADGALGSRGAALLAPYSDDPNNQGLWIVPAEDLLRAAVICAQGGWQLAVHAIGDAANRATLDAFAAAQKEAPGKDLRFRVEHAQIVAPEDLPRFADLGVIASMQPTHATSDMGWAEARIGEGRLFGAYAWRSLLDRKAHLAFGSDFPVEEVSPLLGMWAAVTRQDQAGEPTAGWTPTERVSFEEALAGFTTGAAYAGFMEAQKGRIAPGQLADLTVYDQVLSRQSLGSAKVAMTIVGGGVVFDAAAPTP